MDTLSQQLDALTRALRSGAIEVGVKERMDGTGGKVVRRRLVDARDGWRAYAVVCIDGLSGEEGTAIAEALLAIRTVREFEKLAHRLGRPACVERRQVAKWVPLPPREDEPTVRTLGLSLRAMSPSPRRSRPTARKRPCGGRPARRPTNRGDPDREPDDADPDCVGCGTKPARPGSAFCGEACRAAAKQRNYRARRATVPAHEENVLAEVVAGRLTPEDALVCLVAPEAMRKLWIDRVEARFAA